MRFLRNHQTPQEENHFWISISDLMTSLLFIFILILAYMILEYQDKQNIAQKKIEAFEKNINARNELLHKLQLNLKKKGINVEIDTDDGAMRITRERLFDSAKADIRKDKVWVIKEVANELLNMMIQNKYKNAINTIFIEGHTDNVKLNKSRCGFRWTNMELSAQRAINTFLLMDQLTNGAFSKLTNKKGEALISYSGYADTRPIKGVSNETEDGRERNRRIQFFFAVNPPSIEELKNED
ncbi:OmpA/MotB family protein [Hydrogenimonas thermophila]|uniref:Flagellar motor protein MotB n=1 Tax=Hydrogenimonas thermophila TaxID=223786 RepID=A0A1I5TRG3_9BACT|nr:OmpA family protein [Hydrogenimonas thermophila]SFP85613.1 Flagellar motor protein MotB [Hydrogenimonas thermophila]